MRATLPAVLALLAATCGCSRSPDLADPSRSGAQPAAREAAAPAVSSPPAIPHAAPSASAPAQARKLDTAPYPWLSDSSVTPPAPVDALQDRFPPPPGHVRVALEPGSFGAWLRALPLAAAGTAVTSYLGNALYEPDHPNVAAVVAIDFGKADLQQCADSVIRLHAEWQWSRGQREMVYRAAAGMMPYQRWVNGDRPVAKGPALVWETGGKGRPRDDHASFRKYLDAVFMFANTGSLSQQAKPVEVTEVTAGDFVVMPGAPGHAVLVLDVATGEGGKKAVLLGQGYMPAQSFQVLRESPSKVWFDLDPASPGLKTPFWRRFPWSMLRRL